ncbi:MAG TPA: hypothetical protein V6D28_13700 [Leptolyngbyaceae cyanobacterium]
MLIRFPCFTFLLLAAIAVTISSCSNSGLSTITSSPKAAVIDRTDSNSPINTDSARVTPSPTTPSTTYGRASYKEIPLTDVSPLTGNDPKALALKAFTSSQDASQSPQVEVTKPAGNTVVVIISQLGLYDDSVAGIRYWVELSQTGQPWKIVWAGSQVKCQPGRGHQDWSVENCV